MISVTRTSSRYSERDSRAVQRRFWTARWKTFPERSPTHWQRARVTRAPADVAREETADRIVETTVCHDMRAVARVYATRCAGVTRLSRICKRSACTCKRSSRARKPGVSHREMAILKPEENVSVQIAGFLR